ncbi:InlB B-repeat-containing protein [Phocaeicola coprophilus]|uniref:InlB B-repeat-containing protein n=1 Tax=Phocaeicola coprophilus TaxID=387090 RepID=UPI003995EFA8
MELKIYDKANKLRLTASPNSSSTVTEEIGGECSVSASFTHTAYVPLDVDDYIDLEGVRYKIKRQYRPKQKNTQTYEYSVKFYAPIHDAEDVLMLFSEGDTTSEFYYDGGPREHLQLWVENMNRLAGKDVWSIGTVISAENKNIEYKNLNCWDAAFSSNGIAATFETEMWADGFVINLCKASHGERQELGYMQGLTNLSQEDNGEVKFFTRLFPLGSTRNIDASKYGYSRLQLPSRAKYVDKNVNLYGVKEETEEAAFSAIYPKYVGTISSIRTEEKENENGRKYTVYYIKDEGMTWNPNDYKIPDLDYMLQFQTGELAGRGTDGSFQAAWHEDTKEWEIINVYPDETTQIPGGVIVPNPGDQYIPWNFALPQEYITAAEQEYKQAVDDYLATYSFDPNKYTGTTDRNFVEKNGTPLKLGWNVRLLSEQYFGSTGGYKDTRIIKVQRKLNDLCQATITCSDEVGTGWKSSVDNRLNNLQYVLSQKQEQEVIDIIKTTDNKTPSDYNVFSALKSIGMFLRKDKPDSTNFLIKLLGGLISDNIESQDFSSGPFGSGFVVKRDPETGKSYIEADEIYIRLKAYFDTLEIKHLSHVGGRVVLSPASMECTRVEVVSTDMDALYDYNGDPLYDVESSRLYALKNATRSVSVYRCYFKQSDDTKEIINEFAVDDLAQCREFNVKENVSQNVSNQYYWRRVVAVGKDYIDLSADDCDAGSMEPKAGDTIVTIGNKTNAARQHVVFLSSYDDDAPCIKLYSGINDYSMLNKEVTVISPNADKNVFTGKVVIKPGSEGFGNLTDAPDMNEIESSISDAKNAALDAQNAANTAQGAVSDLNDYVDGAFSDGIIEKSEAQAIEKYINTVNQTKKEVEATYNALYANPYLTGTAKTTLLNAKVSFFGDVDALIESINTAISDGKTTASEKSNVDSKYNAFNSSYATLSTAIENANKAIQDKLKELAAQEAVESVRSEIESVSDEVKDDLAEKMGYSSFSAMVTAAEKGETIISGGHINTDLIEADAIITSALIASAIKTNRLNVNDKFIVEKDGTFKGVEGVLERMSINGSLRSPFSYDGFTGIIIGGQKKLITNNIIVTNPSGGNLLSFIPGGDDYDGFSATIINYDSEEGKAVGSVQLQCTYPIWEGGKQTTFTILDAYEGIDIQGFSNGSSFIGWIIKNRFKLSASAVEMVNVSAHANPAEGGKINGTGIKPVGTKGTLQAIANSGYLFKRWNDDTTNASKEVIWDVDKQYTAYFEVKPVTKYTLTLNVSPAGSGTVSGAGQYDAGTEAKISATPNSGYAFDRWSDGDTNTSRYITMNSSKTFTAYFAEHTISEDNLLAEPKVTIIQSTNDAFGGLFVSMLIILNKKTSEYEYADGILTINKSYLAGKIKAGLKYRLTFEHFGGDGQEAFYAGIGDLGEEPSNSSNWDLLYDGSVDAIVIGQGGSSQKTTFTKEFTARRTSTASDGLFFAGQVKDSVYITNFELKEI